MKIDRRCQTSTSVICRHIALAIFVLSLPQSAKSQATVCPATPISFGDEYNAQERNFATSLFCIDLFPTPSAGKASGTVRLTPPWSPFGVSITAQGNHRNNLSFTLDGLPNPNTFGNFDTYVAWISPLSLYPVEKLGEITNGSHTLGEVSFNKYIIMITAENSSSNDGMSGPLVLRGRSPSSKLEAHDLLAIAPAAEIGGGDAVNAIENAVKRAM